jgi:hypothetical protein
MLPSAEKLIGHDFIFQQDNDPKPTSPIREMISAEEDGESDEVE